MKSMISLPKLKQGSSSQTRLVSRCRTIMFGAASAAVILLSSSPLTMADEACTQMQVLLAIAPNHREDVMAYIAPRLKQKLGVDIVTEAVGSVVMRDQIAAQGNNPRITIAHWDVPIGIDVCDKGGCAPIDFNRAPNLKALPDWAFSKNAAGQPVVLTAGVVGVGILYNEEELKKHNIAPPQSWSDLTRSEYSGRLGITAPQSSMGTAALVMLAKINGGGETKIEPGFDATKAILPKNTVFTWSSEMSNLFQLGDLWLAVNSNNIAPALRAKGLPIYFALPKEGSPTVNTGISLIKGAPCEAAAYEYLSLYFSDEFQALRMASGTASPLRSSYRLLTPQQQSELGIGPDDLDKFISLDWRAINEARPAWLERWAREMH